MISNELFRKMALEFDGVVAVPHFTKESFRTKDKKIFATLQTVDRKAVVKLSAIDQSVFCLIDQTQIYPVAGTWGKQGWTIIDLERVNKQVLADLLEKAYHAVTKRKAKD